jgi:hypothetical protein
LHCDPPRGRIDKAANRWCDSSAASWVTLIRRSAPGRAKAVVRSPGRAVRRLQRPFGIAADGVFATFRVVRRFQRAHGTPEWLTLSPLASCSR